MLNFLNSPIARKLLVGLVVVAVVLGISHVATSCYNASMDEFNTKYKAQIQLADSAVKFSNTLKMKSDSIIKINTTLESERERLQIQLSGTKASLTMITKDREALSLEYMAFRRDIMDSAGDMIPRQSVQPVLDYVDVLEVEGVKLRSAVETQDSIIQNQMQALGNLRSAWTLERTRADSLQTVLVMFPRKVPSRKFLGFIPMPSPTTMFIAGVAVGAIVTASVVK